MDKDHCNIMLHGVEFIDVKIVPAFANIIVGEVMEMAVECNPGFMESGKGIICMGLKVSIIYEVKCCIDNFDQARIGLACENAQKHFLHVLILHASPLRDKQDPLVELAEILTRGHSMMSVVCPLHNMVFENTFVQLVEKVGCEAWEDVAMWEASPKWIIWM